MNKSDLQIKVTKIMTIELKIEKKIILLPLKRSVTVNNIYIPMPGIWVRF